MNLYANTSRWKIILFGLGLVFMILPLFYSNYLAKKLSALELSKVKLFEATLVEITNTNNLNEDASYEMDILNKSIQDLQVVSINRNNEIEFYNFPEHTDTLNLLNDLKASGPPPVISDDYTIYYRYPIILTWLSYFPLVQLFLLLLYAGIGYAVFNASRKEEQNRIWVGMAKETAHQLGTPISGMMGWIEHLRTNTLSQAEQEQVINEMEYDVQKLQQVAERFSKIGSKPELILTDLLPVLESCKNYIAARASRNIQFEILQKDHSKFLASININLFSWVIENLLRNSLDAMDQSGRIEFDLMEDSHWIYLDIKDSGKGIPNSQWKTIFKPGFTTKTRGWGLGLSLARRIIENYHQGKIYVKNAEIGKGTTISIQLPRTNNF
ncbi:MAG: HAMP domain-containing sensor histidine kinase [Saprospiraceae bacterium]|nr:HAMP domain-containing histidine kinase [Saprospiraceae bacterium]